MNKIIQSRIYKLQKLPARIGLNGAIRIVIGISLIGSAVQMMQYWIAIPGLVFLVTGLAARNCGNCDCTVMNEKTNEDCSEQSDQ